MKLTEAQRKCLKAVAAAGSVVIQSGGRGLAAGQWLPFMPETYLRLVGDGLLMFQEPRRLVPTPAGRSEAEAD